MVELPPLGIKPKWIHDTLRRDALIETIRRYLDVGQSIRTEWIEEYNSLVSSIPADTDRWEQNLKKEGF